MLYRKLLSALAAIICLGLLGQSPASAADLTSTREGYGKPRVVHHHVYRPRYHHVYHVHADPYFYRYEPRGYYPYYNSGYWRGGYYAPRPHYILPRYYKAWGYDKPWRNKEWHTIHHGHHYPWHW